MISFNGNISHLSHLVYHLEPIKLHLWFEKTNHNSVSATEPALWGTNHNAVNCSPRIYKKTHIQ